MTQQEYENKIKELEKQLAELKMAKVEEPQQPKRWKPKNGQIYWLIDRYGDVSDTTWNADSYDTWQHLSGNCFETKKEAEEYKKQIEYTARYKNYIEEHSEPIDWCDTNQPKWYVRCSLLTKSFYITYNEVEKHQGTIYASSKEIIKDAIKEIGEDNFKKYVLGVK